MDELNQVLDLLEELQEDTSVSKNVKLKIQSMRQELKEASKDNLSLIVNKILSDLEELSSDVNIPMFVRTQIWSITSLLESLS
ncbi:MAG: UPF0147 family protein [Candidatus Woesearchaeota archaeon]